jgi:phosphatidylglycerol:prolipoprotein diacylglycerol transferase
VAGGLLGARLFHVALNWEHYSPFGERGVAALLGVFALWEGGLVFFGAFVAALIVAAVYCRVHKLPILAFMDLAMPGLIAGQAFGRLGCLMRGCCFGKVCHDPWALRFPPESQVYQDQVSLDLVQPDAVLSLPVYPTQLFAALGAALVAAILYAYWPRRRYDGQVVGLGLILAAVERFFEEFLRGDVPAGFPALSASLTIGQWFSLGLLVVGAAWLVYFRRQGSLYMPKLAGEKTQV